jgi:hypothetical protein
MVLGLTQPLTEMSRKKVKQSNYKSGQALKGSRRLRLPDFKTGLEGFQEVEASRCQDRP